MSLQRNVQQQNDTTEEGIRRVAARFVNEPSTFAWLHAVLRSNRIDPASGLLVRLHELPDQGGNLMSGTWLTWSKDFLEFEVLLSRATGELLEVERFANVTRDTLVSSSLPGTGRSFGFLACRVLSESLNG